VWIKASIQEYILRSWSLVKMGTTANQKKLFFNLRKAKSKISVLDEGDMRPDQVETIAKRLGVTGQDVIDMNRRFGGDASLNAPIRADRDSGEWQDWLVDQRENQETTLAESEELDHRRKALTAALLVLNDRERRIFVARRLADDPITLAELAGEFGVSRERVRQIDVRSFEKVQTVDALIKSFAADTRVIYFDWAPWEGLACSARGWPNLTPRAMARGGPRPCRRGSARARTQPSRSNENRRRFAAFRRPASSGASGERYNPNSTLFSP
jgi:RNA polymerase sigma factor (sigma-70 family)